MPTVIFSEPDELQTALAYLRDELGLTNIEVKPDLRLRIFGLGQEALWHALDRVDHTRGQCNVFKCKGRALRPPLLPLEHIGTHIAGSKQISCPACRKKI